MTILEFTLQVPYSVTAALEPKNIISSSLEGEAMKEAVMTLISDNSELEIRNSGI